MPTDVVYGLVSKKRLAIAEGSRVYAVDEVCECGAQLFACPFCGSMRCLRCDPLTVKSPKGECCAD